MSVSFLTRFNTLALVAAIVPALALGAPKWYRIESSGWELLTDSGDKAGAQVLAQLQDLRGVIAAEVQALGGRPPQEAPPVRVILFRSARDFRPFQRGENNRGIFQSGGERDYILLSQFGDETLRGAAHELVHLTLHHSAGPLPRWLEEGLSDYYSSAQFSAGAQRASGKVIFGKPVPLHLKLLAATPSNAGPWSEPFRFITLREDAALTPDAGDLPRQVALYYAQSWALVHTLMSRPSPHEGVARFVARVREGIEQSAAFREVFGKSVEQAIDEVRQAVAANRFPERAAEFVPASRPPAAPQELPEVDALVARADALLATGRVEEAGQMFQEAVRRWPEHPAPAAGMGYLALRRGDYDAARRQLELAIARGDRQASTHFEYAMLVRDTKGPEALVVQSLRQAVEMSPRFAEAWYALGAALLRQGGGTGEAVAALRQATAILPRQPVFWEAYGRALLAAGDRAGARDAARSALHAAVTPEQSALAQSLLREAEAPPPKTPPAKPAATTARGWQPQQGDATVQGRLVFVDCDTALLKFHIETKPAAGRTPAQKTILASDKPGQIMLRGGGMQKREFVCGPQAARPLVEAGYIARPAEAAEPPKPEPPKPEPPKPEPPKPAARKGAAAKKAPPKRAAPAKPVKPAEPPIAGELVWLAFQ